MTPPLNLRALQIALAGCLLWLLLLPIGPDRPEVVAVDVQALAQLWLDDGLADDQPDFAVATDVFTRPNDREGVSAGIEPSGHIIAIAVDPTAGAGFRRLDQSGAPAGPQSAALLRSTRNSRAPPA